MFPGDVRVTDVVAAYMNRFTNEPVNDEQVNDWLGVNKMRNFALVDLLNEAYQMGARDASALIGV